MTTIEKITEAITNFVKGGDTSNVELLNSVLHHDFRVASNNFMGTPGVVMIDKQTYLSNIKAGIFGGLTRTMTIESINDSGTIAMVKFVWRV